MTHGRLLIDKYDKYYDPAAPLLLLLLLLLSIVLKSPLPTMTRTAMAHATP